MQTTMLRKANTYFYLLTRNNSSTIYCRIGVEGDKVNRSTSQKLDQSYWNQDTQRVKSKHPQARSINETLSVIENQVRQAENMLINRHDPVTVDKILEIIEGENKATSYFQLFYEHNKKLKELVKKGDRAKGTYTIYSRIERYLKEFVKEKYDQDDIYLADLDLEFVEELQHWFKTEKDISHNTTLKYIESAKKIVNIALRRGYILTDPFADFTRKYKEKVPTHLTMVELKRIEDYDFSDCERLEQVQDYFVFACYTGLAFSDMDKLDRETDFYEKPNGEIWLQQCRTKTDEPANLLLLSKAKEIYKKYQGSGRVVPTNSNQKMNAYLKEIGVVCRIKKNLTTHVARHTFATTITLGNGLSIETVQILMGHKNRKSTEHYARVTNYKITSDMRMLKERLNRNLQKVGK